MKVTFYATDNLKFEVDGEMQIDVFEKISSIQEVFSHTTCGVCGAEAIFRVREDKEGNKYYEMYCIDLSCRAKLAFGQNKKGGTLYPKRKDKEGNWIPNNGWEKYEAKPA
jgi:hypothetical protein